MGGNLYFISEKCECGVKLALDDQSAEKSICLIQDGVYLACKGSEEIPKVLSRGIKVFVIEKDVKLRGIEKLLVQGVKILSYSELVDMIFNHDRVINV